MLREVIEGIKNVYDGPLWVRLSVRDYAEGEMILADWIQVVQWLEELGIDCVDVSTGGLVNTVPTIPIYQGYQTPFASAFKKAVPNMPIATVGLLDNPGLCEHLLQAGEADLIMEGRVLIRNVNWLSDAAKVLHDHDYKEYNNSYQRGQVT